VHSPFVAKVTVKRSGESRRAKLLYLRQRVGKAVRLTEKRKSKKAEAIAPQALAASSTE
jgi:large subunit ribosomal protein L19